MPGRVDSKVALVTGGASGIGAAIARRLADEGAKVTITDVSVRMGEELAADLACDFIEQDVADERDWIRVISHVQARFGELHILANNAGISADKPNSDPEHASLADWQRIQRVNVEGVFLGCRAAIPLMARSGGGSIVNLSSVAALRSNPDSPSYGASKAAVLHLTKSIAVYCARSGYKIRCNSVHPGLILTPLLQRTMARIASSRGISVDQVIREAKASIPLGEFQEPDDIAQAVLFLASDESRQVTGAQLVVDGGCTAQ